MTAPDEFNFLLDDETPETSGGTPVWRIAIADDDQDVHDATVYALRGLPILGRRLEFVHAFSAEDTLAVLHRHDDIAVLLLDVVMETEDAGLKIVKSIRQELGLTELRIILRTGQPGYAPEMEAIARYDINDYKTKSELTRIKLYTALTAAIRCYEQLQQLNASRTGLQRILDSNHSLIAADNLREFAEQSVAHLAAFLGIDAHGVVCSGTSASSRIIGGIGRYAEPVGTTIVQLEDQAIRQIIERCFKQRCNIEEHQAIALFCPGHDGDIVVLIDTRLPNSPPDRYLTELFSAHIGLCADNIRLIGRLRDIATIDPMVGLPNRLAFIDAIDAHSVTEQGSNGVVALLSIDCFAEINDVLDSRYGDLLLQEVARCLRAQLPNSVLVARVAGASFGLLGAEDYVDPLFLHGLFRAPVAIDGIESLVSFSIGLVRIREFQASGAELFQCASIALKRAKASGQIGLAAYYTPETRNEIRDSSKLLHALRLALQNDFSGFFLVYQPQIDLESGKVIGLEALLRWRNDGCIVAPDRFIPVAEQSGLIVPLGQWILRTALTDLRHLLDANFSGICMAVNVSAVQFRHPNFLQDIDSILLASGVAPDRLELEITESAAIIGVEFTQHILHEIKARRISIAIDDFGTGYSSLAYLDRLPIDRLKIDRSFVVLIGTDQPGVRITEMVVPLGRQLGMKVLAEGVEMAEQVERLRQLGCDEIQGYYSGRPMPLPALLDWLAKRRDSLAP